MFVHIYFKQISRRLIRILTRLVLVCCHRLVASVLKAVLHKTHWVITRNVEVFFPYKQSVKPFFFLAVLVSYIVFSN